MILPLACQVALASLCVVLATQSATAAGGPIGTWLTEDTEAQIRIAPCGGALCGNIAALREPFEPRSGRPKTDENNRNSRLRNRPLIGVEIIVRMTPNGTPGEWSGRVYNPEDGGYYPATLRLIGARTLRLEGCMMKDVLCRGQTWTRTR
jgi:uncharacterized protein (DUF2147 family)